MRYWRLVLAVAAVCWLAPDTLPVRGTSALWAATVYPVYPGGVLTWDATGDPQDGDQTTVVFWNQSDHSGQVEIQFHVGTPPAADPAPGFLLLDNSLRVSTDLPPGSYRMLIRREYDRARVRARNIRESSLRVLRRKRKAGMMKDYEWRIARPRRARLRAQGRKAGPVMALRRKEAGRLGQYGYYPDETYVWTVVDQNSSYAVGGMPIPEPATWGLLATGSTVLGLGTWWRRRRKAR